MSIYLILEYELEQIIANAENTLSDFIAPLELWEEELERNRFNYELEMHVGELRKIKYKLENQIKCAKELQAHINKIREKKQNPFYTV